MTDYEIREKCSEVFDEYVNQLERIAAQSPSLGSFLESDLVSYCKEKGYKYAINQDRSISEPMEKALHEKCRTNFTIEKEGKNFSLQKYYGPNSEPTIFYLEESN